MKETRRITTRVLGTMKKEGKKISALTAYDATIAKLLDRAGIDIILVGDSLAKVVTRAVERSMIVTDMPFMSYQVHHDEAFRNAGRIMKETSSGAVKLEGGIEFAEAVRRMTSSGIPVMGHLGLQPQSIFQYGGYQPRGKTEEEATKILSDAMALQHAGAFAIVLEKIPSSLAKIITESLTIPTIGIGAGKHCDGQILVYADMLGLTVDFSPRFVRRYDNFSERTVKATKEYIKDIVSGDFPNDSESYV